MLQVTFAEISRVLQDLGCGVPAAEGHGCLCGALCAGHSYTFERWREELLADDTAQRAPQDEHALRLLFSDTLAALDETIEDFAPLLPDDDVALEQRTNALAQWAAGFLYGFGTALPSDKPAMPQVVDEVLRDFARIAAVAVDVDVDDDDLEEQEQAYAELVEYLRAGVWLLHAELAASRSADQDPAPDNCSA